MTARVGMSPDVSLHGDSERGALRLSSAYLSTLEGSTQHLIEIAVLHNGQWTPEEEKMRANFRADRVYAPDQGAYIQVPAVA